MIPLFLFVLLIIIVKKYCRFDKWGEAIAAVSFYAILFSFVWIPIMRNLPMPGSEIVVPYDAPETTKPLVLPPNRSQSTMEIVELETPAVKGKKRIYLNLFHQKKEIVITRAISAKYKIIKVPNPDYHPVELQPPSQCPITTCCDGTCSQSTGRGTCSWHGGVCGYN